MRHLKKTVSYGIAVLTALTILILPIRAQDKVTSPEEFFGFLMGTDRKMARWDRIVDYFNLLAGESGKIKVINMGPSTMGNPFLVVFITSEKNMANLEHLQKVNATISNPRGVAEDEIKKLVDEGRAVMCQSMSLHATEIGGTQMTPELAHDLLTRTDEETQRILDNVIFIMIPSFNPDGQIMVTDWYRKTVGTDYEGSGLPWLYHLYAGHDNNRDGDYINLAESEHAAKIIYREWPPQAYIDHHHMGSYGARFYVPPYCDPIRPYADPLVWREMSWYGAHIAYKLEESGKSGILNAAQYPGWGHFGWHWVTPFHNIAGMLTESASARLASPLYIHPEQLQGGARQFPDYEAQSTFPHPWPGGWWRLRDIVEQKKIAAWALLDLAARNRKTVLWNAYLKAKRQTERGAAGTTKAFLVPPEQHDPLTARKMINTLLKSGLEISQAEKAFSVGLSVYPKGTYIISLAQPKMGLIQNLLGRTFYADNKWTRDSDGRPLRPYDLATHNMNEFMGVDVHPVQRNFEGEFKKLESPLSLTGSVEEGEAAYLLDGRLNDSFRAVNLLHKKGATVLRVKNVPGLQTGDFIVSGGSPSVFREIAAQTGVTFNPLTQEISDGTITVKPLRIGMYQRYYGGNMDEGWTRLVLENFNFPYTSLKDKEIKKGDLNKRFDVIILPSDSKEMILGEISERTRRYMTGVHPDYRSGIGLDGLESIKDFVNGGGTLITLAQACGFAIDTFDLDLREVTSGLDSSQFFCPGSTLHARVDSEHPLGYGMPDNAYVVYYSSPAYAVIPGANNTRYQTVVRYADNGLLRSGWLVGEEYLANKAAMIDASVGKGRIILFGFRVQNRCQTHGTFKLLFNALIS